MPDVYGRLTQDDLKKVSDWFARHWSLPYVCPVSHETNWEIAPSLCATVPYGGSYVWQGGTFYPEILVVCRGCGHILHFNAAMMGIDANMVLPPGRGWPVPQGSPGDV